VASMLKRFKQWFRDWKPIHLCWWFRKHGWRVPKYLIGSTDVAPHNMTANDTPPPYVISASSYVSICYPWKAFDGVWDGYAESWESDGAPPDWIKIDMGAGNTYKIESYAIQCPSGIAAVDRMPKDFTLQGSNNDSDWDVLDTVTGETGWSSPEKRTFTCDVCTTAYRYFKINVTANNGGDYVLIGEIDLYAEVSAGWTGKIGGVTDPAKVGGVSKDNIKKIGGVE